MVMMSLSAKATALFMLAPQAPRPAQTGQSEPISGKEYHWRERAAAIGTGSAGDAQLAFVGNDVEQRRARLAGDAEPGAHHAHVADLAEIGGLEHPAGGDDGVVVRAAGADAHQH